MKKILKFLANLTLLRYKPKVIGITGSVGKTSAKRAVESVLGYEMKVRSSSDDFDNKLSVLMAVLGDWKRESGKLFWFKVLLFSFFGLVIRSKKYPDVLVIEYNVNRPGDMKELLDLVRPDIGVVTAMGQTPAHIEYFPNKEALIREKSKLVSQLPATGFSFLNIDDSDVFGMSEKTRSHIVSFGFDQESDLKITSFETVFKDDFKGITFKLNYGGSFIPVRIRNVLGKAQAYSAAIAAGVGIVFDMNLVDISESLSTYESPPARLKIIEGIKKSIIIDDTYNATPLAMKEALGSLGQIKSRRKVAVLGDMLELGEYTLEIHQDMGKVASEKVDLLITTGMRGKFISETAVKAGMDEKKVHHIDSIDELKLFVQDKIHKNDVVLIKAAGVMGLEAVVKEVMAEPEKADKLLIRR